MTRGECSNCRELAKPHPDTHSVFVTLVAASAVQLEDRRAGIAYIAQHSKYSFAVGSFELKVSPKTSTALGLEPTKVAEYVDKIENSEEYKAREKELAAIQLRISLLRRQFDYEQNRPI